MERLIHSVRFSRANRNAPDDAKLVPLCQPSLPFSSQTHSGEFSMNRPPTQVSAAGWKRQNHKGPGFFVAVKQKRQLCPGLRRTSRTSQALPLKSPRWDRNINRFPFHPRPKDAQYPKEHCSPSTTCNAVKLGFRTASPVNYYSCHGTLLHFGPQSHLLWVIATSFKICTTGASTQTHVQCFGGTRTYTYSSPARYFRRGPRISRPFERHPFSRQVHLIGELLHTP